MPTSRAQIIAEARSWIGTPYRHQASLKGVGCDCLGLVRGIWRAFHVRELEPMPAYAPDWAEATGRETLAEAAARHLTPIDPAAFAPGDLLLFRWRARLPAKHAAIASAPSTGKGTVPVNGAAQKGSAGSAIAAGSAAAAQAHDTTTVVVILVLTIALAVGVWAFWHWWQQRQQEQPA